MRLSRMVVIGGALLTMGTAAAAQDAGQVPVPPPGRTYAFDVASVKPGAPDERLRVFDFQPTGRLVARNQTLRLLIAMAYGTPFPVPLPDERLVGGPDWMATARFAVEARSARPPDAATAARDIGFMLSEVECPEARCGIGGGPGRLELRGATLDLLVLSLAELVGRPVVNQTGLDGPFDGAVEWAPTPDETQAIFGGASSEAREPHAGASIFTALEEQLGLKLRDARAPIETVVITRARRPSPD